MRLAGPEYAANILCEFANIVMKKLYQYEFFFEGSQKTRIGIRIPVRVLDLDGNATLQARSKTGDHLLIDSLAD